MIPYGRQDVTSDDIEAVVEVLRSDFLTQGPKVTEFEQAVARFAGARHAVAVNSATSALYLACLALGVGAGDTVWTSAMTFVASANCARYCGADVDFVDIDAKTYNISIKHLQTKLEYAAQGRRLPKVVIPVHFSGQSCEMEAIHELAQRYGFRIIEDASHAIGGQYRGQPIGIGRYSDITVFSFHPVKIITTGEGGMALTNDTDVADRIVRLRSHGITRDSAEMTGPSDGPWYYQQLELGFNFRMTDIQAALGLSQLRRLNEFVVRRRQIAARYDQALADVPLVRPWQHPDCDSAFHLYVVQVDPTCSSVSRRSLFNHLREAGIGANVHYIPVHTHPYYRGLGFKDGDFPNAEFYYAHAISLPIYPALSEADQTKVIDTLRLYLS